MLRRGEMKAEELRDEGIRRCEEMNPSFGFLVTSLADRSPGGVPLLLKDAGQEVAGTPLCAGVAALRDARHRSTRTTPLARSFEEMGFSIIGKSACPPLASGVTTEPPGFAPTRNPWDPTRSASGSSGGAAAAVACGAVAVAHGSDATGSLRFPAAVCGLVTLVPTAGRVESVAPCGQPPNDAWRDFVIARDVEDLALVFEQLIGPVEDQPPEHLRVGLLDHDPELGLPVHSECAGAVRTVGRLLEELGHEVDVSWPPPLDHLWQQTAPSFGVVSDHTRPLVLSWLADLLGRPPRPGELPEEVFEAARRAERRGANDLTRANVRIETAVAPIESWWQDHDLLVTPTTFQPAWPLGGTPGVAEVGDLAAPFSLTGQPAMSLPLHQTPDGLPVGVQLVGRRGGDEGLLALAAQLQDIVDWTERHPPTERP